MKSKQHAAHLLTDINSVVSPIQRNVRKADYSTMLLNYSDHKSPFLCMSVCLYSVGAQLLVMPFKSLKILLWSPLSNLYFKILGVTKKNKNKTEVSIQEDRQPKNTLRKTWENTRTLCKHLSWRDLQCLEHNSKTNDPFRERFQTAITWRAFAGLTLRAHLWGKLFPF